MYRYTSIHLPPVLTTLALSVILLPPALACSKQGSTEITFYGFPDNSPPGAATAFDCGGRNNIAGGSGTFNDPVTFASAPGEFHRCEVIYIPYLEKYGRMEDTCDQCTTDWESGKRHIDIWTGSPNVNGGSDQINCEDALTPDDGQTIIRNPSGSYTVDSNALYRAGASPSCRNGRDTYPSNDPSQFCSQDLGRGAEVGQRRLNGKLGHARPGFTS